MSAVINYSHSFSHPPEKVFEALISATLLAQWWGPPNHEVTGVETDPVVGGQYSIGLRNPKGVEFFVKGEYREITAPSCLVFTADYHGLPKNPVGESLVTIRLNGDQNGTVLNLQQQFSMIPTNIESRTEAWQLMYAKLNAILAG